MSERCQTKIAEKIENQNLAIFCGITLSFVAVLYFYKFHLATIAVSYVLGCLACYSALSCSTLHIYLEKLKQSFVRHDGDKEIVETNSKGCMACGANECSRHDGGPTLEPWTELKVHKQLDQAIEDFYNAILENFITSWYNKITPQPFFVDELRHQLRYASACLLRRAVKINYSRFITERLIPCALRHYTVCCESNGISLLDNKMAIHPAATNRNAELQYLRSITNAIMPYLLKNADLENSVFRVFIREIFSGWVLLSLTDVLSDPYILNSLILIATSKDIKLAQLPTAPNYKVEFLDTFVRQIDTVYAKRSKLLRLDLEYVLNDPQYLYAFMQFMKTTGHIHLLQFCKDIKSFQTRILNPELTSAEQVTLFNEAWEIWLTYFDQESPNSVPFEPSVVEEMRLLLADGAPNVKKLQTSRALYEAARQSHVVLEKTMLPKFLHSEEYYKLVIGPRIPPGFHKHMIKRPEKKVKSKARHLRGQTPDGQFIGYADSNPELNDDEIDINLLKYIAQEEALREQDLSTCKVVLTHVETIMQEEPRRGTIRMFTIAVHRIDPTKSDAALWTILRSENDFHLLRAKLTEFHGEGLLQNLPIPSRRDNSPLETIRYKYEDFLQRLLQMSLLQTSELLRIFLMEEGDFTNAVLAASLAASSSDLTNLYQSVTHRLRKEKGQHLEGFMNALLISCDKDKWEVGRRDVELAQEIDDQFELQHNVKEKHIRTVRNIHASVFENNFDIEPQYVNELEYKNDNVLAGFTQCFIYLLMNVVKVHNVIVKILGSIMGLMPQLIDVTFNTILNKILRKSLCERRLAHLIRIGHGLIFERKSSHQRVNSSEHAELAKMYLLNSIPSTMRYVTHNHIHKSLLCLFDIIQQPHFNKQLVYNLLDLCLLELFPELVAIHKNVNGKQPKS